MDKWIKDKKQKIQNRKQKIENTKYFYRKQIIYIDK